MKSPKKIGEYLVEYSVCSEEAIRAALAEQLRLRQEGIFKPLGEILLESIGVAFKDLDGAIRRMHIDILAETDLFRGLSPHSLQQTISIAEQLVLPENQIIFNQGDKADTFIVVIAGEVQIFLPAEKGKETVLTTLGAGEGFGEMALLTGEPRSASVKTITPTSLIILSKSYFDQLCVMAPDISQAFTKILSNRLAKGNIEIANAHDKELAYQELVKLQAQGHYHPLVGRSRSIKKIGEQIEKAARSSSPLFISGEKGTAKVGAAHAIHKAGSCPAAPFLTVDAKNISIDGEQTSEQHKGQLNREIAQSSALFGYEKGALPFAETRRLGFLQVAEAGTIVVENAEYLTPNIQARLLHYMQTKEFTSLGDNRGQKSDARLIFTSKHSLDSLKEFGNFSKDLIDRLETNEIHIPPLRKRKSDLLPLLSVMLERFNGEFDKSIKGVDPEAYRKIMAYDWPENLDELEVVIRRGVNIATGEQIGADDLFIGLAPVTGKYAYNLLRLAPVRTLFASPLYPRLPQFIVALIFLPVLLSAFWGSQDADKNIALAMVWSVGEPLLVLSWLLCARIGCSVCPMGAANDFMNRTISLKLTVPAFIRKYGGILSIAGIALVFLAESASGMHSSPKATGMLLLSILVLAMLSGFIFERRLWCRYLCPLGKLGAFFSSCSIVEWRANNGICNSTCRSSACFKGNACSSGCPLYHGPFSLQTNQDCILCGNCLKVCEDQSPVFNLRIPGHELWSFLKPDPLITLFVPVVLGIHLFRGLGQSEVLLSHLTAESGWFLHAAWLVVCIAAGFSFINSLAPLSFTELQTSDADKKTLLKYSLLPFLFCLEIAFQLEPLVSHIGHFFTVLGNQLGIGLAFLDFQSSLGTAAPFQVFLVLSGLILSITLKRFLAQKHQVTKQIKILPHNIAPVLLSLAFLLLFMTG